MFQGKRYRHRSKSRGPARHSNGNGHSRMRTNSFSNGQRKNHFRPTQSAEKLFEKYSTLAKEAMSSGDKTLSENYLQHADHFMRIVEEKNKNQVKTDNTEKSSTGEEQASSQNIKNDKI